MIIKYPLIHSTDLPIHLPSKPNYRSHRHTFLFTFDARPFSFFLPNRHETTEREEEPDPIETIAREYETGSVIMLSRLLPWLTSSEPLSFSLSFSHSETPNSVLATFSRLESQQTNDSTCEKSMFAPGHP